MEWYPTPSYLLKRKLILDFVRSTHADNFLEVGCGAGDLLAVLGARGFRGVGIDFSAEAVMAARRRVSAPRIIIEQKSIADVEGLFDLVIASEVLEHCPDDVDFLRQLHEKLCPGGSLVLTVPAHMAKWGANDDFCGHLRRYERQELHEKLAAADLLPCVVYSYGVPVYNLMKPFYDRAIRKQLSQDRDRQSRTECSSGMWLFTGLKKLFYMLFNDATMYPFYLMQRLFLRTDLGNGYFVVARKRGAVNGHD